VIVAYELAALTWALTEGPAATNAATGAPWPTPRPAIEKGPLGDLAGAHLFGEPAAPSQQPAASPSEIEAPATALDVRLTGIVRFDGGKTAQAIIAGHGSEKNYAVGDAIDGAGATLRAVFADHTVIEHDGRLESMWLPKSSAAPTGTMPPVLATATTPPSSAFSASPAATSPAAVAARPATAPQLREVMLVGPQLDETGSAAGFTLSPGRNMSAFNALGLQSGDRVIDVNGVALGQDPTEGPRLFTKALGDATTANLTVMRGEIYATIVVDSGQLLN
jgi:general secretion pathway protein C